MDLLRASSDYTFELSGLDALYREIGRAITAWASVEGALCDVLMAVKGLPPLIVDNRHCATSASFFAVENFRSKLAMIDAACDMTLPAMDYFLKPPNNILVEEWKGVKNKCARLSQRRNWLAHYMVMNNPNAGGNEDKSHFLTPNIYNMRESRHSFTSQQKQISLADVSSYTNAFEALGKRIRHFAEWCGYASQLWSAFDEQLPHHKMKLTQSIPSPIVRE